MERNVGKWVPIGQYSRRRRVSKSTVYRRIRNGELTKRVSDGNTEIFLTGEELELFDQTHTPEANGADLSAIDVELGAEDAYSIADQTLRTMIAMHREVLAEKSRMLEEWEAELKRREEKLQELVASLAGKEAMLNERTTEARELRRSLRHRDEVIKEQERALLEYRRLQEQREEIDRFSDSSREELTTALAEKDKLMEGKDRLLEEQRLTYSQRDAVYRENNKLIDDLKKAVRDTQSIIAEKDEIISRLQGEPVDIEGKLKARDQTVAELRMLIKTLESQLEMQAHAQNLTGFSEEKAPGTATLIQDQLEYLMQKQSPRKYSEETVAPVEDHSNVEITNKAPEEEKE